MHHICITTVIYIYILYMLIYVIEPKESGKKGKSRVYLKKIDRERKGDRKREIRSVLRVFMHSCDLAAATASSTIGRPKFLIKSNVCMWSHFRFFNVLSTP